MMAKATGILLESVGESFADDFNGYGEKVSFGGIILSAPASEIVGYAESVYFTTRIPGTSSDPHSTITPSIPGDLATGGIVFDSAGDFVTRSDFVLHYNQCGVICMFGEDGSPDFDSVTSFTPDGACIVGDSYMTGNLVVEQTAIAGKDFVSSEGHFYSGIGGSVSVGGQSVASGNVACGQAFEAGMVLWAGASYQRTMEDSWYSPGEAGHSGTMQNIGFSYRTNEDYGFVDNPYTLSTPRWATMCGGNNLPPDSWSDSGGSGSDTAPFPGTGQSIYVITTLPSTLMDIESSNEYECYNVAATRNPDEQNYTDPDYGTAGENDVFTYPAIGRKEE